MQRTPLDPLPTPTSGRRLFIGDVQGCREELEALLETLDFDPAADVLRPVGDLVNRGPDNVGCLRLLRDLSALSVLGNHDLHLLGLAAGSRSMRDGDTLSDVLETDDRVELLDWLAAQPYLRVDRDVYQVHAGLSPRWAEPSAHLRGHPERSDVAFATRVRTCDQDGLRPDDMEEARARKGRFRPWFEFYDPARHGGRTVAFGHWSVRGLVVEPGLRGLDTGCVWGGRLTAWIAEEDRFVSVPARRQYQRPGA